MESSNKKILFIESDVRAALSAELLAQHNFIVYVVHGIAEAEDKLAEEAAHIDSIIMSFTLDGRDLDERLQKKVLDESFLPGWLFYEEIICFQYPHLAKNTIFFASDIEIETIINKSPEWYKNHRHQIVSKTDFSSKELILGLLDAESSEKSLLYDYEAAKNEVIEHTRLNVELKRISDHIANVGHEMRTPLNSIMPDAHLLLSDAFVQGEPDVYKKIGKIYDSSCILLSIVNNLLDVHKIKSGRSLELRNAPYSVEHLIRDATGQCAALRKTDAVTFSIDIHEKTPVELIGDEQRVLRIMLNILSNAWKYTPSGFITLSVWVALNNTDNNACLHFQVTDTGIGMTESEIKELGEEYPFFMGNTLNAESTGLGMFIVKKLLDLMKGTMTVESEKGKGTKISVGIPQKINGKQFFDVETVDSIKKMDKSGYRWEPIQIENTSDGCVLLVEDIAYNAETSKSCLEIYGLDIEIAESGEKAIEKIKGKIKTGGKYDIIFMDQYMPPGIDGIETTRIIRELGYNYPIIALTANVSKEQATVFLNNKFDDFISKPINRHELDGCLKKHIKNWRPVVDTNKLNTTVSDNMKACIANLAECLSRLEALDVSVPMPKETINLFKINLHNIKSPLYAMRENMLSEVSAWIWQGFHAEETEWVAAVVPYFLKAVRAAMRRYSQEMATVNESAAESCCVTLNTEDNMEAFRERLLAAANAFKQRDPSMAKDVLAEIEKETQSQNVRKVLTYIASVNLERGVDDAAAVCEKYAFL